MPRPNVEAERREQISIAACAAIAETGLRALRLTDIAKRAGISSGTIHYYFDTKRDVVTAAFELNFQRSLQTRHDLLEVGGDASLATLREVVASYLRATDESMRAWRVWSELWSEGLRDEALRDINRRLYRQWRDLIAELVRKCQFAGQVVDGDPLAIADVLVALIDGMTIQHLMHSPTMPLGRMQTCLSGHLDSIAR